jgi:hypothetical protein
LQLLDIDTNNFPEDLKNEIEREWEALSDE